MDWLRLLRQVSLFEGLSLLALLLVAMPLKYVAGIPAAVTIVGGIHGVLFVAFCWTLMRAHQDREWGWRFTALVFVAGSLPFGFLWSHRALRNPPAASSV